MKTKQKFILLTQAQLVDFDKDGFECRFMEKCVASRQFGKYLVATVFGTSGFKTNS